MQKHHFAPAAVMFALSFSAASATAQVFDDPLGFAGVNFSLGTSTDTVPPDSELDYTQFGLEGQYGFPIFGSGMLGASIDYGRYIWDEDQPNFDEDVPQHEMRLAFHYTQAVSADFRLGGFAGYTRSRLVVDDLQREPYETVFGGLEAQYFVGDTFMLFGQAGAGDVLEFPPDQSEASPEGFQSGTFFSAGVTWFPVESTGITFRYEDAGTDEYQDGSGSEAEFESISFSGETRLPTEEPFAVTYFVRRDYYDVVSATNRSMTDLTAGVGVRILFGPDTPRASYRAGRFLDVPRLPGAATDWLELLD